MVENWKRFKKRWSNYALLIDLSKEKRELQIALLENCLSDDALKILEGFKFDTEEDARTVDQILEAFENYTIGETNQTLERFKFGKRQQAEGESIDKFITDLRTMMKTCGYCNGCSDSILRDRIVVGVLSNDTREELLKYSKLTLKKCIETCKAMETASAHSVSLNPDSASVNKIRTHAPEQRQCAFCPYEHAMRKEECPAWGKECRKCGRMNHHHSKCYSFKTTDEPQDYQKHRPTKTKRKPRRIRYVVEESDSEEDDSDEEPEWCNTIKTSTSAKSVKCKMEVEGTDVRFLIDTGASINTLPAKLAPRDLEPYKGTVKMWNEAEDTPLGCCRLNVRNPKNNKKYNVPFVVFKGDRVPILGYRTSLQMRLVTVEDDNFHIAAVSESLATQYPAVFDGGLGSLPGTQRLTLDPDAQPKIMATRRTPIALRPQLKEALDKLVDLGVIEPVDQPTPWVSQIVLARKRSGEIRVCLDPHELNKAIQREHYTLPILEDVLHDLRNSTVFSKADLSSGYWHVKLDEESSYLTTFQTCFGRYRYTRLPFGINGASEYFQKRLLSALDGVCGIVCVADDVIIHGITQEEHDQHLHAFLAWCQTVGIKLNPEKVDIGVKSVTFMGHCISSDGVHPDPEKISAITNMKAPEDTTQLRRFIGMINYLAKFMPHLTSKIHPLQNLLKKDTPWMWSSSQEEAFDSVKKALSDAPTLAYYDPNRPLTLENDACEYGLGSALIQDNKPVAFASRCLSDAEKKYAQIEKEMLAVTFGLEKFHHYTYGRDVNIITDHKPLVSITAKPLSAAPKRLQNLLLRAQKYSFSLSWKPGAEIPIADTLSRAPSQQPPQSEVINIISHEKIGDKLLQQIRMATALDSTLQELIQTIMTGWPHARKDVSPHLSPYFDYRDELSAHNGIAYRADRVIIPTSMRKEMKQRVHTGHLGINSCIRRARDVMYWPGMSAEIRQHVETCGTCSTYCNAQPKESPITSDTPDRPWVKVATDLFEFGGKEYLIIVDYHSGFFEVDRLHDTSSNTVIMKLKAHFLRYGAPITLISDNGPQYSSGLFKRFSNEWQFTHVTSSPGYSQSNGAAEAAVKTMKRLLRKCKAIGEEPFLALLNLRNTPSKNHTSSPVQRLFGRRTRSLLPTSEAKLTQTHQSPVLRDQRLPHSTGQNRDLKTLQIGDNVRMQPIRTQEREWKEGTVTDVLPYRSFEVTDHNGRQYRRNRRHLRAKPEATHSVPATPNRPRRESGKLPDPEPTQTQEGSPQSPNPQHSSTTASPAGETLTQAEPPIITRSGRTVIKPLRYQ